MTAVAVSVAQKRRTSRKEQYRSMLRLAAAHSPRQESLAGRGVDEVRLTLRRHDRIEWFLRLWCRDILHNAQALPNFSLKQRRRYEELRRAFGGVRCSTSVWARSEFLYLWWRTNVEATRLPLLRTKLRTMDLRRYRTFDEALQHLLRVGESSIAIASHQYEARCLLEVSDGLRWYLCEYGSSLVEGRLLGHCGNQNNRAPNCVLLSLRERVIVDGVEFWQPHLTFTLDDGWLGEMKGRDNTKPQRKYHFAILLLLVHPEIRGFSDRLGALPDRDLQLSDFNPRLREILLEQSPSFHYQGREAAMRAWRDRNAPQPVAPVAETKETRIVREAGNAKRLFRWLRQLGSRFALSNTLPWDRLCPRSRDKLSTS